MAFDASSSSATRLFFEGFDYAEDGVARPFALNDVNGDPIAFFGEAASFDYFGVFDGDGDGGSDFGGDAPPVSFNAYAGFSDNYLAGSDIDGGSPAIADPAVLTWTDVAVAGATRIRLSLAIATEDGDAGLDPTDFVRLEYRVDGGAWTPALAFETADATTANQPTFLLDADFDGIGDGAALTGEAAVFAVETEVAGALLDLRLLVRVEAGFEDVAVDDIAVDDVSAPPSPPGETFTLQILHASDLEGGVDAIERAPNFAAIVDALEAEAAAEGWASILLSAGDNYLPGPFAGAAGDPALRAALDAVYEEFYGQTYDIRESIARVDVTILNILGFDASAIGNHEFDFGANEFLTLVNDDVRGALGATRWLGTFFPYLSANLDFSGQAGFTDGFDPVVTDAILPNTAFAPNPADPASIDGAPKIAQATVIERDGELIGVVGATTQRVASISSTNGVVETTGGVDDMAALAAALQPVIDDLIAGADDVAGTGDDVNKVILVSHLQDINLEKQLAGLLRGVDVIIAGGSDTRLADATDRLREGDAAQGDYPFATTDANGDPLLIVSTDGEYSYVGRLVVEFDADGRLLNVGSGFTDPAVSGAYVTDDQGVTDVTGAASAQEAVDASQRADLVERLVDAVSAIVTVQDGAIFGRTDVFIEGRREFVRTEETTLGNLSADANLAYAQSIDPTVLVSIKNGGGIRAAIGEVDGLTGALLPTSANSDAGKEAGDLSQLDIQNALRFNNGLTLLTLSAADLAAVLEHAVAATGPGATPGQFPQVSGLRFSFDASRPVGERIVNAAVVGEDGALIAEIVRDGEVVGDPGQNFRIVTLNFLAGGGDGYPFPALGEDRVDLVDPAAPRTGAATFAADGSEQDAFAEFLAANFSTTPYAAEETGPEGDLRIQNLAFRGDAVFAPGTPVATMELGPITAFRVFDSLTGEGGSEVVAHEDGVLYVTNGGRGAIDVWDIAGGTLLRSIDLTVLPGFDGVQSVAVKGGLIAAAVSTPDIVSGGDVAARNGYVALIDAATGLVIDRVTVGALPDSIAFTPDGTKIVVANEGEFSGESSLTVDAPGSISIIDVSDLIDPTVTTIGFDSLDLTGLRLAPPSATTPPNSIEPEYVSISADGLRAYVTLQEANAIAVVDLVSGAIVELIPAGAVDHSAYGFELDPNDDGAIGIRGFADLVGLRMPDAIATFEVGGVRYLVTANEGDSRGDPTDGPGDVPNPQRADEARVRDILRGDVPGVSIDPSVDTRGLERLTVSIFDGDTDGDGDIDVLHAFGARSFTIFDEAGNVVFDSGSEFERIIAEIAPERFNNDDGDVIEASGGDAVDNRSDAKGPEPEAVAVGVIGDQTYAFIGLERDSGVMIYNVTDPAQAYFVDYIAGFGAAMGDNVGPETIVFIPAADSVTGVAQIAVAYEVSGTTVVYDLGLAPVEPAAVLISEFQTNPPGADPAQASFEISGEPGATFSGVVVFIESDAGTANPGDVNGFEAVSGVFDANGLLTVQIADPENPSFTVVLAESFAGDANTDFDANDDGVADQNLDLFGRIFDAIGVADEAADQSLLYGAQLGGTDLVSIDFEPEIVFRDGSRGALFQVRDIDGAGDQVFDAAGVAVDPADFDVDPRQTTFGALNPVRGDAPADFDLQVTEIWFGQDGADLTADWFEITNVGTEAWTIADGGLFYDDDSVDVGTADAINGVESIAPGESVIVMIGGPADVTTFRAVWGDVLDLANVQVGFTDGAGLGAGGDAVSLFIEDPLGLALADLEAFPDTAGFSGRSWDVGFQTFSSVAALDGVVETLATGGLDGTEPAVGSPGLIPTEAPQITLISAVQGPGAASPLAGQRVTVQGVVTLLSDQLNGFFLQEEDADADGDAATSEGVFVFLGTDPTVSVGQLLTLDGEVSEFFGLTQLSGVSFTVEADGVELPSAVAFTLPLPDATDPTAFYESLEGMRVSVSAGDGERLTVTDTFTNFGEVGVTSGDPLRQPTQDFASFTPEQEAATAANARDFILFENAVDDSLSSSPRVGDGIVGDAIEGVMHFTFSEYKIETAGPVAFDPSVNPFPRQDAPEDVGGRLKVASFNVLNYFTTLGSRGAETAQELADQTAKIVAAITAIDADVLGLIEIENDLSGVPDEAVAALVDALNAALGAEVYDYVATGRIGTDEIKQAILYKPATVAPTGAFAVLEDEAFTAPFTPGDPQSRPALAQTFTETATGEVFTVSVNHFKSKGSTTGAVVDGEPDDNPVEGSAALTRVAAAEALAAWIATDPTGSGDPDHLTIGDFNAYAMERAIKALEAAGFENLAPDGAVSYQFDGRLGTLDYAFANESLAGQVTGATIWNVNSLEAYAQQYSTSQFAQLGDPTSPFGSSDHDPVIVGLDLFSEPEGLVLIAEPGQRTLVGGDGDDTLIVRQATALQMEGGDGEDTFRFETVGNGRTDIAFVRDFTPGEDVFSVAGLAFEDLSIRVIGGSTRVTAGSERDGITFVGVTGLTENDYAGPDLLLS